ncbi:histone H2A.Z-specific chaperone CHZ1-like [Manduca sexta]|uniref:histone H2A.Z-specific chaperone CHZ1-like n=1 Tax=Manduca sexta TaxID=7130 RepID=UPI00188FC6AB|nr:histone H2A.Z-specific chaperone CHZ1-like [Manduca sexta]
MNARSDERKGDDHLDFSKSRTGFRQEISSPSKVDKISNIKYEAKKPWASHDDYDSEFDVKRDDDEDVDYEAADYEDDDIQIPEVLRKAKKEFKKKDSLDLISSTESSELKKKHILDLESSSEISDIKKKITPDSSSESLEIKKPAQKATMKNRKEEDTIKTVKVDSISKSEASEPKQTTGEDKTKKDEIIKKSSFKIELDDEDDDDDDDDDDDEDDDKPTIKIDQEKKKMDTKAKNPD